jgi:colicin import membrane protein
MTPSTANGVPYTIPPEPNRLPSILIALLVHAGLLGFLWIGVRWQNVEPVSVEAEVWDMKTESAAPPPKVKAEPVPEPEPVPKVIPPPPKVVTPPTPKVAEPVAPKAPDIALERLKEQKKKLAEKKLAEEKLAEDKLKKDKLEKEKEKEKAKQLAQLEEKQLADQKAKEKAEKLAKEKADRLAKAAQDKAEAKKIDDLRAQEMKRLTSQAGGTGSAEKSTAPRIDTGYVAAITSKIKRSTSYSGDTDVAGNPRATFKIEQLPTGEIISVRKTKSSGIAAFDNAVERGINNSSPLPKKKDGTVERSIEVSILMKELN